MSAEKDVTHHHFIRGGRFVCTAPDDAPCRVYPDCECEAWTLELHGQKFGQLIGHKNGRPLYADRDIPPAEGHQPVPQPECWLKPWIEATDLCDTFEDADALRSDDEFPDGPIVHQWNGDYVTWAYVLPPVVG